jgi:dienelactone hydrolase
MTGYASSLAVGKVGSELTTLFTPRIVQPNRRAIIFAHGASGSGAQANDPAGQPSLTKFFGRIASAGYVVLSADWGGPQTYGNDTELAAMEAGWTYLKNSGLCAADKIILTGASMGTLSTHRFAKEHPTWVAGLNCWIPFLDIEAGRTNDWLSLRQYINPAWGMPVGSYIGSGVDETPLPANAKPLGYAAVMAPIPTHMWYSTADVISTNMDSYIVSRAGAATAHVTSTAAVHSDAAVAPADINAIISFFDSIA